MTGLTPEFCLGQSLLGRDTPRRIGDTFVVLFLTVPFVELKNIYDCPFILLHITIRVCFFQGCSMILTSPWCIFRICLRTKPMKPKSYIIYGEFYLGATPMLEKKTLVPY